MADLKPGWRLVKFGEVVRQVKEKVDPATSGLERYVAGEHMDTDDLRIRRWGEIGDGYLGPAFHMRFKPGQVLYGSRRTYLRKVAVADFEGICANTTFVLESADPSKLLPEFLPFVMQTDAFHEHSKRESKGSVNPYVNFSDLAWYEFALPPLEEQRRTTRLLQASRQLSEESQALSVASTSVLAAARKELLHARSTKWAAVPLHQAVSRFVDYRGRTPKKSTSGVPLVTAKTVRDGYLDFSNPEWIAADDYDSWMTRGIPREGDVLFTTEAPLGLVARAPSGKFALAQRIICLQPAPNIDPSFLHWTMRGLDAQRQVHRRATGTTVKGIKQSVLREIVVRIPPLAEQRHVASTLDDLAANAELAEQNRIRNSRLAALLLLRSTSVQ